MSAPPLNYGQVLRNIQTLVKALEAGGYNAAPSTLNGTGCSGIAPPAPKAKDDKYPHECPRCHGPAYIGLNSVDCKAKCK